MFELKMNIKLIIAIIILVIITLLLIESIALHHMQKSSKVYISDNRLAGGVIFSILTYSIAFLVLKYDGSIGAVGVFAMLCVFNLFIYNFPRISYDDSGIDTLTFLFRKHHFEYSDITGIKWGKNGNYVVYLGRFRLYVDETAIGGTEFLKYIVQRREKQLYQRIPEISSELFHGYFVNPKELLIAYLLLPLFITGCFIAVIQSGDLGYLTWGLGVLMVFCWIVFFAICFILNHAPNYRKIVKLLVRKENWRFY